MKNGKIQTLSTMLSGFLMESWRNLFKKLKALKALETLLDLLRKAEHLAWESLVGTHTFNKTVYPSKDYKHNSRQDVYLAKLRLNLNEHQEDWLRFMVNLFGVVGLVFVTLILGLLLLLCLIVSLPVMLVLVLSLGPLMFSLNKARRVRSLGRTEN